MKIYRFLKADYTELTIISHICPLLVQFFLSQPMWPVFEVWHKQQ